MNPGDPDVSNRFHRVTHHLGGDARFFENGKIACPGADDGNCALAVHRTIAPNTHCPGFGKVLCFRRDALYALRHLRSRSGQKEVARFCQKRARDLFHLVYRLAHPENHFRHAVAESPVVVYLCKS